MEPEKKDTYTCPSGHTFPHESFHSYVEMNEPDIMKAILFDCPGGKRGHTFTLERAVRSGMFTLDEAVLIRNTGRFYAFRARKKESDALDDEIEDYEEREVWNGP